MWLPLAIIFPAIVASANVLSKFTLDRYSPSVLVYGFWLGIQNIAIGPAFILIASLGGFDSVTVLGGFGAGAVGNIGLLLYIAAYRRGQVTRLAPIFSANPILVAVWAGLFLGERLSELAFVAFFLAVLGGLLVSIQKNASGNNTSISAILFSMAAAATLSVSAVLSKYFLDAGDSFWQYVGAYRTGAALMMMGVTLQSSKVRTEAFNMTKRPGFLALVFLEETVIVTLAMITRLAAISMGPVSLVAAFSSAQPAMIFIYCMILAKVYPQVFASWITRSTIKTQIAGMLAIAAAVIIIALSSS